MVGVRPRLSNAGPGTYEVVEAVKGGQVVEARAAGKVGVAALGSTTVLGVAEIDARPFVNPISTDSDGFETINVSGLPSHTVVGQNRYPVTYAADCAFGKALKAGAAGTVRPWVSGTDAADLIIGFCDEPGGVVVATNAKGLAAIGRG